MKPPFPFFGGKSRWAPQVWDRLGAVDVYAEPFAGSLAVLLGNPHPARREVVSDTNGLICNFWRALASDPEALAHHADYPTIHQDLTARHAWLQNWAVKKSACLSEDPHYYDAKAAGWWVWGISLWIGSSWCLGRERLLKGEGAGQENEVNRTDKRPFINNKIGGRGIARQRLGWQSEEQDERLGPLFKQLAKRLRNVVVLNRDWSSAVTPTVLGGAGPTRLSQGIFLDPPYRTDGRRRVLYSSDSAGTSDESAESSYQWAVGNGERYRVVYCCHKDDFPVPDNWEVLTKEFHGHSVSRAGTEDCLMFSPACGRQGELL